MRNEKEDPSSTESKNSDNNEDERKQSISKNIANSDVDKSEVSASTSTLTKPEEQVNKWVLIVILILCNAIIFAGGVSVINITLHDSEMGKTFLTQFDNANYFTIEITIFITLAVLMIISSILGHISTLFDWNWIYILFFVLMIATIICSISGIVTIFTFKSDVDYFHKNLLNNMKKFDISNAKNPYSKAYNNLQSKLFCCGVVPNVITNQTPGWKSWGIQLPEIFNTTIKVPASCCKNTADFHQCQKNPSGENSYIHMDCFNSLKSWLYEHRMFFLLVGSFMMTILPLHLTISYLMMTTLRNWEKFPIREPFKKSK